MRAVVKLGGSVAHAPLFRRWLGRLAAIGEPLAIVPGGGHFADAVRAAQPSMRFSDAAAHAMAILAMEQTALAVLDLQPGWVAARTPSDFRAAERAGRTAVWLPSSMTREAPDIPMSWDVTADSLSAWLAGKLGAETLVLIKQSRDVAEGDTLQALADRGIVDTLLPRLLPAAVRLRIATPDHLTLSSGRALPGTEIARQKELV